MTTAKSTTVSKPKAKAPTTAKAPTKAPAKTAAKTPAKVETKGGNYLRTPTGLRKTRSEKGLSQALIAKELEVALSTYGGIERGDIPVSKDRAEKIGKLVGKAAKNLFKQHKSDKTKMVAV